MEFRLDSPVTKRDILKYNKLKIITISADTKDIATFNWKFLHRSLTLREESFKQIHNRWIKTGSINTGKCDLKRTLYTLNYFINNPHSDMIESNINGSVFNDAVYGYKK
ncbi:MAG: hypothetical protein M0R51_14990 [Clostridia bacterium]|jgi:hypothetical protein|nr:hypothetical protein [Clostridia bacterium]